MKRFLLVFCAVFSISFISQCKDKNRLWNMHNLAFVKAYPEDYREIIDKCIYSGQVLITLKPLAVVDKQKTFAPDMHYYCSMSPYFWPEMNEKGETIYKVRDGQANPEAKDYNRWSLNPLSNRLQRMALAFYFTGDVRIYEAFIEQLDVWFLDKETRMYPSFDYAQVVPGQNNENGNSSGIIEASPITTIIESICLVDSCKSIGFFRRNRLKRWFGSFLDWMLTNELGRVKIEPINNIGSSCNVTMLRMAFFTGADNVAKRLVNAFPAGVRNQIQKDGRQPNELRRTKAFHYSTNNLRFIVEFCTIAKSAGYEVYGQCEDLINSAASYLSQFVGNESSFPYKQITDFEPEEKTLKTQIQCIGRLRGNNIIPNDTKDIYDIIQCYVY